MGRSLGTSSALLSAAYRGVGDAYLAQCHHHVVLILVKHDDGHVHLAKLANTARNVSTGRPSKRSEAAVKTHNCLHMPQGLAGGEMSVATAMARKSRTPEVTAVPKATRSAHVPTG